MERSFSRRGFLATAATPLLSMAVRPDLPAEAASFTPPLTGYGPDLLCVSPDGKTGYMPFEAEDTLLVLDLVNAAILGRIDVAAAGTMLASASPQLTPDGRLLFVPNFGTANVMVIDTQRKVLVNVLPLNPESYECLHGGPDGRMYLVEAGMQLVVISPADLSYRRISTPSFKFIVAVPSRRTPNLLYCIGPQPGGRPGDKRFFTFDLATGAVEREIPISTAITPVAFKIDAAEKAAYWGTWLQVKSNQATGDLCMVDLASFKLRAPVTVEGGVKDLAIHEPSGKVWVQGTWTGALFEWDPSAGKISDVLPLSQPSSGWGRLKFDPTAPHWLYSTEWDWNFVRKLDLQQRLEVMRINFSRPWISPTRLLAVGDKAYVVSGSTAGLHRLDLNSGKLSGSIPYPEGQWVPGGGVHNGRLYLSADSAFYVVNPESGEVEARYPLAPNRRIVALQFFGDKAAGVAKSGATFELQLFESATMKLLRSVRLEECEDGRSPIVSPDGSKIYMVLGNDFARALITIFDSTTLEIRKIIEVQSDWQRGGPGVCGDFDSEKRIAYLGGFLSVYKVHMDRDELLGMLNLRDAFKEMGRPVGWTPSALQYVKLSPGRDKLFIVSGDSHSVYIYDLAKDRWLPRVINLWGYRPAPGCVSPDGRYLYTPNRFSDSITRLDTESLEVVDILEVPGPVTAFDGGMVRNAASFEPSAIAPGELVTIFGNPWIGTPVGPNIFNRLKLNAEGRVANELAGCKVFFDDVPAPLIYAYASQVTTVVPYAVAGKSRTWIRIELPGLETAPVSLGVTQAAPGIFTANSSGKGQGVILNQDGAPNSTANPAARGSAVMIYATGEGATEPAGVDGKIAMDPLPRPLLPVAVWIQGREAEVLYAGAAPGMVAGVMQVNIRLPMNIPSDDRVTVQMRVGNALSQSGVTMAVR